MAHYQAWHDASQALVDLSTESNGMLDRVHKLQARLASLEETVEDAGLDDAEASSEKIETAKDQLSQLDNKLQRPPPRMSYRQYPRLGDEVGRLMSGIVGVQARPTEAQMTVLAELQSEAAERQAELQGIIDGPIGELNQLLGDLPAIVVPTQDSGT